jgi:hypothetical protein
VSAPKATGRLAGRLWLLSAVSGGFGLMYIRTGILVSGDATATAANIHAHEPMFRAAIVAGLAAQVFWLFLALTLFHLFKDVSRRASMVLLVSATLTVGLSFVNALNFFSALLVLGDASYLNVFSPDQRDAAAMVLMRLANSAGQGLLEVFWTPFYFSFGWLVLRSGALPRFFGWALGAGSLLFAVNVLQKFLLPSFYPAQVTQLAMLGGVVSALPTMVWLLVRGATAPNVR